MAEMIAFLGNPGREYERSRHNVGWMVADLLTHRYGLSWQDKFDGRLALLATEGRKLRLLKPMTFMNRSGQSVVRALSFFSIEPEECVVVHDDLELGFGKIVFKSGGGTGGHNGLKSIISHLGTRDFGRIRIGIGRPSRGSVSSYVLSRFTPEEEAELPGILEGAADLLTEEVLR
jgi:PTH1 family peptidyl-tRNA hydrolase